MVERQALCRQAPGDFSRKGAYWIPPGNWERGSLFPPDPKHMVTGSFSKTAGGTWCLIYVARRAGRGLSGVATSCDKANGPGGRSDSAAAGCREAQWAPREPEREAGPDLARPASWLREGRPTTPNFPETPGFPTGFPVCCK